ncbi:MAG: HPr kinase/phosphorylase [Ignavibacteria bacterium]|nr:HPr kinase/phosphorylase [Ignavibacteria bacterium]
MADRFKNLKQIKKNSITVDFFFDETKERFKLKKITPSPIDIDLLIKEKDTHRPGLALAGYVDLFSYSRVQIFGNTEMKYLNQLSVKARCDALKKYFSFNVPCVIVTNNNKPPAELIKYAAKSNIPVFKTAHQTTRFISLIHDFLDDQFSSQVLIHGSFVDVYGVGLLFCGESGIGKSEVALDLIERGHRLVADDVVFVMKKAENILIGSSSKVSQHLMEIRGMGIIDIRRIFGVRSIRYQKRVEVVVELEKWSGHKNYERTGINTKHTDIMGVETELINLPIFPGKNITVIAEVIALNYLCKHYGYDAAKEFQQRLNQLIKKKTENADSDKNLNFERSIEWFEHDFE